jgi:hypothetical protein
MEIGDNSDFEDVVLVRKTAPKTPNSSVKRKQEKKEVESDIEDFIVIKDSESEEEIPWNQDLEASLEVDLIQGSEEGRPFVFRSLFRETKKGESKTRKKEIEPKEKKEGRGEPFFA